jgi:chromosome partitioning protein
MFDERTNLAQQVMAELKNFFGETLCRTTIPRNIRLAEAPSHGKAALEYDPRSKGAESYIRLAKEIIERQPAANQLSAETFATEGAEEHGGESAEEAPAAEMDKSA